MFETMNDVPEPIKPYYREDVRSEPTGEMVQEEYTYTDEEGVGQTAYRDVPEMHDVTYIVTKDFGETQDNVGAVMARNKSVEVVERFLGFANNSIDKAFHDAYIEWLSVEPVEPTRARDEEGHFISDDEETETNEAYEEGYTPEKHAEAMAQWEASEPVKPEYKVLTDYPEYPRYLKLLGVEFEGVMCSATKEDFYGLAVAEPWIRKGNSTVWEFDNGSKLTLHADNVDAFYAVWMPFRASFFGG